MATTTASKQVTYTKERYTRNTYVYSQISNRHMPAFLYIPKLAFNGYIPPQEVTVTINWKGM